jgi:thiamine-monophosphate kinase
VGWGPLGRGRAGGPGVRVDGEPAEAAAAAVGAEGTGHAHFR